MNTTIKQQIAAVQRSMRVVDATIKADERAAKFYKPIRNALNDAASTLAAVGMIGEDKIKALPELIRAATYVCKEFDDDMESFLAFNQLKTILNKFKN